MPQRPRAFPQTLQRCNQGLLVTSILRQPYRITPKSAELTKSMDGTVDLHPHCPAYGQQIGEPVSETLWA